MSAPPIQTTTVGSYPVPDWLVALPSEQTRAMPLGSLSTFSAGRASICPRMASSIGSISTIPIPTV